MKLTHTELEKQLVFETGKAVEWIIESPASFSKYVRDLYEIMQDNEGKFTLSDEDEIIDAYRAKGITDVDEIYLNYILPEKMKYNLKYIETFGFFSDMKIMLRTAMAVIK